MHPPINTPFATGLAFLVLHALASVPTGAARAVPPAGAREMFPNVLVDAQARTVEFEGHVPIRLDDPRAPRVYLEQIVCTPDTKEHESLVVASVKPSHVHAALLALGYQPGTPATWRDEGNKVIPEAPRGDGLGVQFIYVDASGATRTETPAQWIASATNGSAWPSGPFVFAGSRMRTIQGREVYDADASGTLIGLTSFGSEVVAWPAVISPDSQVQEPEWIARVGAVPPMNTKVRVRLIAPPLEAGPASEPADPAPGP